MKKRLTLIIAAISLAFGGAGCTSAPSAVINANVAEQVQAKEFTMTSYYAPAENRAYFSLPEIVVNKGDRVRIKVTNTMGSHDFVIKEYNIARETPLNEEQVIEFTADKAGEFVYYCSRPGHRESGQWGTLKVL